ncbi:hypothetical protein [Bartonella sp. CL71SXKL]
MVSCFTWSGYECLGREKAGYFNGRAGHHCYVAGTWNLRLVMKYH